MRLKETAKRGLARVGVQVHRLSPTERVLLRGYDPTTPLPPGAASALRPDHPRLRELETRYQACRLPMCQHSQWAAELRSSVDDLRYFRGDNAYLWQYSRSPDLNHLRFFVYAKYVEERAGDLLGTMSEDGAFGCFTYSYEGLPLISRDVLDSANELHFLREHWGLFGRESLSVADIGAGYGRLAHRMAETVPALSRYWCLDAVPRSTFLSEYYLAYRGVDVATAVPVDTIDKDGAGGHVDLAIAVHSLSEMSRAAIEGWLRWLHERAVPSLFLVPNERDLLLSTEVGGQRQDCADLLAKAGYVRTLAVPTVEDGAVRDLFGVQDFFVLYERQSGRS